MQSDHDAIFSEPRVRREKKTSGQKVQVILSGEGKKVFATCPGRWRSEPHPGHSDLAQPTMLGSDQVEKEIP